MKKIIVLITLISASLFFDTFPLTIDVQNNSDGQIQLIPDPLAQQALAGIGGKNPLADIILNNVKQEAIDRMQQGLEQATILFYSSGETGSTNFGFCPRQIQIKKLSGTGIGKTMSFYTNNKCTNIKLDLFNAPNGFGFNLRQTPQNP